MTERFEIVNADSLEHMPTMEAESIDSIVTDPPYGLSFMGKDWDHGIPGEAFWREAYRVAKPGAHLLAFGGTRTFHRLACAIEDAGWEIRDCVMWVYGSGFPKSLDVSKAIDKGEGENRARQLKFTEWMRSTGITAKQIKESTGTNMASHYLAADSQPAIATADLFDKMRPYLPEVPEEIERLVAERTGIEWTAYKNREVVGTAKWKTLNEAPMPGADCSAKNRSFKNITAPATDEAKRWNGWGTALKPAWEPIIVARKPLIGTVAQNVLTHGTGAINIDGCRVEGEIGTCYKTKGNGEVGAGGVYEGGYRGEWNSDNPHPDSVRHNAIGRFPANLIHDGSDEATDPMGEAQRYFYCAKASKADRTEGCDRNHHPTVKPTSLMRYLCRLVTPPDGIVLDPFTGSGSTGKGAILEGFRFYGIEKEAEYAEIARARIEYAHKQANGHLFKEAGI